jgi:hypothetical protein
MRLIRCLPVIATLAFASVGGAQIRAHEFTVSPRGGYLAFDRASSIKNAPSIGLSADYNITPALGLGVALLASRPNTRGEDFVNAFKYGDSVTYLFQITQPLSVTDVSLNATVRAPLTRIQPYLSGGVGAYTIYLDPQASNGPSRFSRLSGNIGVGVNLRLSDRAGVLLESRGLMFTNYKRSRLNPSRLGFADVRYVGDYPAPPKEKSTIRSYAFNLGFSFVPSRHSVNAPGDEQE